MPQREALDLDPMILIVSKALADVRARKIRESRTDCFDVIAEQVIGNDIVHSNARAFDTCVTAAHARRSHDVAVGCGGVGHR